MTSVASATNGSVALDGGVVTFVPTPEYSGSAGFQYTVSDGELTATAQVTLAVQAVDDAPVAQPLSVSTNRNAAVPVTLRATDIDTPAMNLLFQVDAGPTHGQLTGTPPNLTYTPATGYSGPDSFTFTARDSTTTSAAAVVSITVVPVLVCGDAIREAAEQCDDGNTSETDGCTTACVAGPVCSATALPGADRFASNVQTGTCYVSYDDEQTSAAEAQLACIASGGHLATITSSAEQALVSQVQNPTQNPWLGAVDDANDTDGIFAWLTGELFGFQNFAQGQPDDDVGFGGNGECLHLMNDQGQWNDTSCAVTGYVTGRVCELAAQTCGDRFLQPTRGEACDDGNRDGGDGCSVDCRVETLVFSEYVEGTSNNKAIELANPLPTPVPLTGCSLKLFTNGASTAGTTLALTQTIAARDVLVVCHPQAGTALAPACDVLNAVVNFNGDDALTLECNGSVVDRFGRVGQDPGTAWTDGGVATVDATLRRACAITAGDPAATGPFDPSAQWLPFSIDTFSHLGVYGCP